MEKDNRQENKNSKRDEDILFTDYKPLHITKESREKFMKSPYRFKEGLPVRIRMGKFYTDEEFNEHLERSLSTPLPGDEEEKGIAKKIKKFFKRKKSIKK